MDKKHNMQLQNIRLIHRGKFLSYYELDYRDSSGNTKTYEMVSRSEDIEQALSLQKDCGSAHAVTLLVFNEDQTKMLIPYEFRMAFNQFVINQISGLIEPNENIEHAAARELYEETGLELVSILDTLPPSYACSGITDDMAIQFICTARGELQESDSINEEIHCQWMDKEQVRKLLYDRATPVSARMQAHMYMWTHS